MKMCCTCRKNRHFKNFGKNRSAPDGMQKQCRSCVSKSNKRSNYKNRDKVAERQRQRRVVTYWPDLTKDQAWAKFNELMALQGSLCAICTKPFDKVCIDHCHATGRVRGILCSGCNIGLGGFKDSLISINKAMGYLAKFETE